MDGPALRFARVVKEFPSGGGIVRALDGLDLAVAPGAFTAVVGRSGSGKSTLLNLILRLYRGGHKGKHHGTTPGPR